MIILFNLDAILTCDLTNIHLVLVIGYTPSYKNGDIWRIIYKLLYWMYVDIQVSKHAFSFSNQFIFYWWLLVSAFLFPIFSISSVEEKTPTRHAIESNRRKMVEHLVHTLEKSSTQSCSVLFQNKIILFLTRQPRNLDLKILDFHFWL